VNFQTVKKTLKLRKQNCDLFIVAVGTHALYNKLEWRTMAL